MKLIRFRLRHLLSPLAALLMHPCMAQDRTEPGLTEGFRWEGRGNWCINGGGVASSIEPPHGDKDVYNFIDVFIPEGATIEKAFLYTVIHFANQRNPAFDRAPSFGERPIVELQGARYSGAAWDLIGKPFRILGLGTPGNISTASTFRADVTEQMIEIAAEGEEEYRLSLKEVDTIDIPPVNEGFVTSGEALVIVYSHPDEAERLIILNDGYAHETSTLPIEFDRPLDTSIAGFEALMSVGIAHSWHSFKLPEETWDRTLIDVDSRRLSSIAGGNDDAVHPEFVGDSGTTRLITVGGLGDKKANPINPLSGPVLYGRTMDDELYDLSQGNLSNSTPYLANGARSLTLSFEQPNTRHDPLFLVAMNVVLGPAPASADLPEPPETIPDEPDVPRVLAYEELYSFTGNGNWSIDAVGKAHPQEVRRAEDDALRISIPDGSEVEKAFLYSMITNDSTFPRTPAILFNDNIVMGDDWTELEPKFNPLGEIVGPRAFRSDVTEIVSAFVAANGSGNAHIPFHEMTPPFSQESPLHIEGEALVVIYSNPSEPVRSILLIDGASIHRNLETIQVRSSKPLPGSEDFEALLSLGIGGSQQTIENVGNAVEVMINDRFLTKSAGGADDAGILPTPDQVPGKLITMGGLGDRSQNPPPEAMHQGNPFIDDELYDLAKGNSDLADPFLTGGAQTFRIQSRVRSLSTTLFFVGINLNTDTSLTLANTSSSQ